VDDVFQLFLADERDLQQLVQISIRSRIMIVMHYLESVDATSRRLVAGNNLEKKYTSAHSRNAR
jgi:hypothetical protein